MMNRRRFIQVSAATMLLPGSAMADPLRWRGRALGADVSLTIHGGSEADVAAALSEIRGAEARFSIYDPASELSRMNASGGGPISEQMAELLALCQKIHAATDGLFDPTIQPVFRALLEGREPPWTLVGWERVRRTAWHITLDQGQEITLNGIAQGFATDRVRAALQARGFKNSLISVGEHAAIGGPFRLSLEDPVFGQIGTRTLQDRAIATSSPGALRLGHETHILHPRHRAAAVWSTVSIEAESAALADGLSTALCLAPEALVREVAQLTGSRITLVDRHGDVTRIG